MNEKNSSRDEPKPEIRTAVRMTGAVDPSTGRSDPDAPRRVFTPGQEKAMSETLTDDQKEQLEKGGFISGVLGAKEPDVDADPTVLAGAKSITVDGVVEDEGKSSERKSARKAARKSGRK